MLNPIFKLRKDRIKKDGTSTIILYLYYDSKVYKYYTGISILPDLWDEDKKQPKTSARELRKYASTDIQLEL